MHLAKAEKECVQTSFIHGLVISQTLRVLLICHPSASCCQIPACGSTLNSGAVLGFVDGLDSIRIVKGKLGIGGHLRVDINAGVNKTNCVNV